MKKPTFPQTQISSRLIALSYISLFATSIFLLATNATSGNSSANEATIDSINDVDMPASLPSSLPTICLSPGHPSYDGDKYYEAIINRKVAYFLQRSLRQAGYTAVLSTNDLRPRDLFSFGFKNDDETQWRRLTVQSPEEKAWVCNEANADYVISIHHNFTYNDKTNRTLVFYGVNENFEPAHDEAEEWAQLTAQHLGQVMKTDFSKTFADVHRLGFPLRIIANSKAPAILTEGSFYSHPKERKRLNDDDYLEKEASAIFDAFHTHYKSSKKNKE